MTVSERVKWIHDCPMKARPCGYDEGGTVWHGLDGINDWQLADRLGLTADPEPDPDRPSVMVAWDCRPGALQCHYWDELERI